MEIRKFGSIYENGQVMEPGFLISSPPDFSLGDTVPGKELQWVELKTGLLIADRCACRNISWLSLNNKGFIFGKCVRIDGRDYICRSLKVGKKDGGPNEWDDALNECGEDDPLWHWNEQFFWGQEKPVRASRRETLRMCRGWSDARGASQHYHAGAGESHGFRPALEPLCSDSLEVLVGSNIKVFGPGGEGFEGELVDFDGYDLTLVCNTTVPQRCEWAIRRGKNAILSRDAVVGVRKIG